MNMKLRWRPQNRVALVQYEAAFAFISIGVVPLSIMCDLKYHEQRPPVPPGDPTVLNKELAGNVTKCFRTEPESGEVGSPGSPEPGLH